MNLVGRTQSFLERLSLRPVQFIIISNNCWGFEIYQSLRRPYNTPFVGLYLYPDCYLKLLEKRDRLEQLPLRQATRSRYFETPPAHPVGLLDEESEIHFLHYKTFAEAREKWERRLQRYLQAKQGSAMMLYKMCDRDGGTEEHLRQFHSMLAKEKNARQISFAVYPLNEKQHIQVAKDPADPVNQSPDGLTLFRQRRQYFHFSQWVK